MSFFGNIEEEMRKEMEERYKQIYSELRAEAENYDTSKFDK